MPTDMEAAKIKHDQSPGYLTWAQYKQALSHGDTETVEKFLLIHDRRLFTLHTHREYCSLCGSSSSRTLELAAHYGHLDVFRLLYFSQARQTIDHFFEYEASDFRVAVEFRFHLARVLEIACLHAHLEIVRLLIEDGLKTWIPQIRSTLKDMFVACSRVGNMNVLRILYDVMMELGFSPRVNFIEVFYFEGLDVDILKNLGMTEEYINARLIDFNCPVAHQVIFSKKDLSNLPCKWWRFRDLFKRTVIDQASVQGDIDVLRQLIRKIEMTDYELAFERTSFEFACRLGCLEVVRFLIDYNWKEEIHWNIILESCATKALEGRHTKLVRFLLERVITVNSELRRRYFKDAKNLLKSRDKCPIPIASHWLLSSVITSGDKELTEWFLVTYYSIENHDGTKTSFYGDLRDELDFILYIRNGSLLYLNNRCYDSKFDLLRSSLYYSNCCLLTFESLLKTHMETRQHLDSMFETLIDKNLSDHERYTVMGRRAMYAHKLRIILSYCRFLPDTQQTIGKGLQSLKFLYGMDAVFDSVDYSSYLLGCGTMRTLRGGEKRRHEAVCILRSMTGWSRSTVRWDRLYESNIATSSEEKQLMMKLIAETGFGVFDFKLSEDDAYFTPVSKRSLRTFQDGLPFVQPQLTLKETCRIFLRRWMRRTRDFGSLSEMLLSLHYDHAILPRSLMLYLMFRDTIFSQVDGTGIKLIDDSG